jgi:hypothetical protein
MYKNQMQSFQSVTTILSTVGIARRVSLSQGVQKGSFVQNNGKFSRLNSMNDKFIFLMYFSKN